MFENVALFKSCTMWGGTRNILHISSTPNSLVDRNCESSGGRDIGL